MKKPKHGWTLAQWSAFELQTDYEYLQWLLKNRNFKLTKEQYLLEKYGNDLASVDKYLACEPSNADGWVVITMEQCNG